MPHESAGLLCYRRAGESIEVFLVHPGGPFWAKKDAGAWSIPKGEFEDAEEPLAAAKRELGEETGFDVDGEFIALAPVRQAGGKVVHAWAVEANFDAAAFRSGTFTMEWPPRSGRQREFPEVDRVAWLGLADAREKMLGGQAPLLDQLMKHLGLLEG